MPNHRPSCRFHLDVTLPSPAARGRKHPDHARGRRRVREAGDALFHRQGQLRHAAPGPQGLLSRAVPPFPLMHVDTTWKFREMYSMRERMAEESGIELIVHQNPEAIAQGINPFDHGSAVHTDMWKTQGLKQALDKYGFDAAFGGARRDEEKSRAKERVFSLPLRPAPLGSQEPAPRALAPLQRAQSTAARASGCSRCRTGPSSTSGSTSTWRRSPSFRSTTASSRPVVERDGALIMVDDERMPLKPGEKAEMQKVRFRTLGCYPLTGAVESDAEHPGRDHPGDAAGHHLGARRAGSSTTTRPRRWRRRSRRAISDGRTWHSRPASAAATSRPTWHAHEHKCLLRFITCGSVDDGKSTLIGRLLYDSKMVFEDQLAALEADSKKVGTQGGEHRLRPAGRRPRRRARAGHHHRRRLPLLLHRAAQVHRRRHARATSSTRATWSPAPPPPTLAVILIDARKGVLTQTRRHSYPGLAARHPPRGRWRSTRWTWSTTRRRSSTRSRRTIAPSPTEHRDARHRLHPDLGAAAATTSPSRSAAMPWYAGPTAHATSSRPSRSTTSCGQGSHCACPSSGSTAPTWTSAASRDRSSSGRVRPGDRVRVLPSGRRVDGRAHRHLRRRPRRGRRRPVGDPHPGRRDRRLAAATSSSPPTEPPEVADQFEATLIWMGEAPMLPGAALSAEDRHANGRRHDLAAEVQGQRQHHGAPGRRAPSS